VLRSEGLESGDFLLLVNVNEWINNECAECALPHLNIRDWFTRSHPLKGENRTRNRSCKCKRTTKDLHPNH
jgi:hypothetical protein